MLERPDQQRRDETAVLAGRQQLRIGGPGEDHVLRDAVHLVVLALASEEERVDFALPGTEPWAGSRAESAALLAVGAVVRPAHLRDVEGTVHTVLVVVPEYVIGADDHAGRAPCAQTGGDDLSIQVRPVKLLGGHGMILTRRSGLTMRLSGAAGRLL